MQKGKPQQYRLKASPKILNDTSSEEPNKTSEQTNADPIAQPEENCRTTQVKLTNETPSSSSVANLYHHHHHQAKDQSSNSKSKSIDDDINKVLACDIKSLFECPVCLDYAIPPINQCHNGHLVCQTCRTKITSCPTCRVPISDPIRNLQLDRLAHTFQFPCKYNFNGCQWKSYWFNKRKHEDSCQFISYGCPCPGTPCKWAGMLKDVMQHLNNHHRSITTLCGEDIVFLATDINLKGAVDWVMIQSCYNNHFLLVLEKQELKSGSQQFFAIVQLIGSPKDAEKFRYKLELSTSLDGRTKKLQWEATPRSILDGIQSAILTYDCLVFDAKTAKHFLSPIHNDQDGVGSSSEGENLAINVTITLAEQTDELQTTNTSTLSPQLELAKFNL